MQKQMIEKNGLIGYTGFVGSNLLLQKFFDKLYNSKNIRDIADEEFDILVCSGVSGTKFLANKYPARDEKNIVELLEKIKRVNSVKKFILISTVDVYSDVSDGDETTNIEKDSSNHYYGIHRASVEKYVKDHFRDYLIVRLPAIYGENLKKNFIFDMIYRVPYLIKNEVFTKLLEKMSSEEKIKIQKYYSLSKERNNTLISNVLDDYAELKEVKNILNKYGVYAERFTDSRNRYQFYNLKNLWKDIQIAIENEIKILNITSYPLTAQEVAKECFKEDFNNIIEGSTIVDYNLKSIYAFLYGGENGYLYGKEKTIKELKDFVKDKQRF